MAAIRLMKGKVAGVCVSVLKVGYHAVYDGKCAVCDEEVSE